MSTGLLLYAQHSPMQRSAIKGFRTRSADTSADKCAESLRTARRLTLALGRALGLGEEQTPEPQQPLVRAQVQA